MAQDVASKTPWEFRLRAFVIAIAFGAGFFFGYPIQALVFGNVDPTFVDIGRRLGPSGIAIAAWACAALAVLAALIRFWGSSYHAAGVVMSGDVVTDTLTTSGPYRYVRNPLYLGNLLLALGVGCLGPPVATGLVFLLNLWFVWRLIAIEEPFLQRVHGAAYERYRAAVPRLIPRLTPAELPADGRTPNWAYGFFTEMFSFGFAAAMVYVAVVAPHASAPRVSAVFWSIAIGAIVLQMLLAPAARRAGGART